MIHIHFTCLENTEDDDLHAKKYVDFNKDDGILYDNFYLAEFKVVIKTPMIRELNNQPKIRIEPFSLMNEVFLISY